MARWTGFFNSSGSPALKISLCGAAKQVSKESEAVADTGFTGFLAMSMVEAFPLGLILTGSSKTILADGSATNDLTALEQWLLALRNAWALSCLARPPAPFWSAWSF